MSIQSNNIAIAEKWLAAFWGKNFEPDIVDRLAASNMTLIYSLHEPCRGVDEIRQFMLDFRRAFPDLEFRVPSELIADGDCVRCRWEGGGLYAGPPFGVMWG